MNRPLVTAGFFTADLDHTVVEAALNTRIELGFTPVGFTALVVDEDNTYFTATLVKFDRNAANQDRVPKAAHILRDATLAGFKTAYETATANGWEPVGPQVTGTFGLLILMLEY